MRAIVFPLSLLLSAPAFGACLTPDGVAGQIRYNAPVLQYCDGTNWKSLKGPAGASCTGAVAGKFEYSGADFVWSDGTACWSAKQASLGTACAGSNGQMTWDGAQFKGCIGGTWYKLAAPAGACTPGSQDFAYSGSNASFIVPAGCESVVVKAWGGGGGSMPDHLTYNKWGGGGAYATATLAVTPGETLTIRVGGGSTGTGAFPNGSPNLSEDDFSYSPGGASSSVLRSGSVLIEAGGGGGEIYDGMMAYATAYSAGGPGQASSSSCASPGNQVGEYSGGGGYCKGSSGSGGYSYPAAGAVAGSGRTAGNSAECGGCGQGGIDGSGGGHGMVKLSW